MTCWLCEYFFPLSSGLVALVPWPCLHKVIVINDCVFISCSPSFLSTRSLVISFALCCRYHRLSLQMSRMLDMSLYVDVYLRSLFFSSDILSPYRTTTSPTTVKITSIVSVVLEYVFLILVSFIELTLYSSAASRFEGCLLHLLHHRQRQVRPRARWHLERSQGHCPSSA